MSFIQEKIINITLGVSKEYQLIHFTDVHAIKYHPSDSTESIEKAIQQEKIWTALRLDFARKFSETFDAKYLLPSTECLINLIDHANRNHPDLVLMTGDIIDYYSDTNYAFMKQSFTELKAPYLFTCGNHESPSHNFHDLCQGNCDFNVIDLGEFFVVAIDNSTRRVNAFQRDAFAKLLTLKKPILMACHIPMMTVHNEADFLKLDDYYTMSYKDCDKVTGEFIDLVSSSDGVKAIFCGHVHGSITSLIAPNKPQYCCSSGLIGSVNKIIIR